MVSTELEILHREAERLASQGFEVFFEPGPSLAPDFAEGYRPDAVAIGNGRKIALEVSSRSDAHEKKLNQIAKLFQRHPEWELQVIWAEPLGVPALLPTQTLDEIRKAISEIKKLRNDQHFRPSFLLGWATFEAAARAVAEPIFGRPQTPGRIIQILGQEGYLSPAEADEMRTLTEKRNRLIHGALDAEVSAADVDRLVHALETVTAEIAA